MPLNDDREEKSVRFHSRQALHEMQMNQIKAAASPVRKRKSLGAVGSPQTSNSQSQEDEGFGAVGGNAVTPMKRVPILANFEEWMKMATDNKINATNSWNFALIDYFHDMSLLREGDSVNFQKASCTLDGCVKIYTSRVDSVATETGKLLSGLADSGNKKRKGEGDGEGAEGEGEDEEDGEEGVKKRARKRAQRSSEATLASSFAQLQLKKMEVEFSVDPLFKKASADFDEGGAKGLLLNHLTIDAEGRIVFDSSDDADEKAESEEFEHETERRSTEDGQAPDPDSKPTSSDSEDGEIDIDALGQRFFPDLLRLDEEDICPSLKTFELGGASDALDIPFLKASDDWKKDDSSEKADSAVDGVDNGQTAGGMDDDDDDGAFGGFDVAADVGFGEGGEAWAREAAIETQPRVHAEGYENGMSDGQHDEGQQGVGSFDPNSNQYGVHLSKDKDFDRENVLSYFDQALQKNWAGPEHWRIRRIKDATKPAAPTSKRKEKEPFEIDFAAPMTQSMANSIFTPAATNSAISLPRSQWKSKTRNLLPDDKHFNSRQLLSLFLKPKARIGSRKLVQPSLAQKDQIPEGELDEAYWARQQNATRTSPGLDEETGAQGNYDANFFQDDGLGAVGMDDDDEADFADAQERLTSNTDGQPLTEGVIESIVPEGASQPDGGFGSQLVTQSRRLRPEYVQYAKVAKKVDVRRLKEEMWRDIGFTAVSSQAI